MVFPELPRDEASERSVSRVWSRQVALLEPLGLSSSQLGLHHRPVSDHIHQRCKMHRWCRQFDTARHAGTGSSIQVDNATRLVVVGLGDARARSGSCWLLGGDITWPDRTGYLAGRCGVGHGLVCVNSGALTWALGLGLACRCSARFWSCEATRDVSESFGAGLSNAPLLASNVRDPTPNPSTFVQVDMAGV